MYRHEEVTVEDCQSPDVLHESESLKSQPASMESGGLSPVYPQYKPTEAYKEIEPVSSSDGFNLSNQEGINFRPITPLISHRARC
ncbi:hypothetical protein DPMN_069642 [Dreissena polymorpha]|uniref:Uncharacterized protein n=1 Tax=Dreissena polymorpha TaxID=45954 RepID=A0A9D3YZW6_DREPO|nr:hypothetical protein DPMN_069642 [Dreissena polymorpha]